MSSLLTRHACCSNPFWADGLAHRALGGEKGPLQGRMLRPRTGCCCLSRAPFNACPCLVAKISSKPRILQGPRSLVRGRRYCREPAFEEALQSPLMGQVHLEVIPGGLYSIYFGSPGGHGLVVHGILPVQVQLGSGSGEVSCFGQKLMTKLSYVLVLCVRTCLHSGSRS